MDLTNKGASPLEIDWNGDIADLPAGTKYENGRVIVQPGGTIPEAVWTSLSPEKQSFFQQTGHIAA